MKPQVMYYNSYMEARIGKGANIEPMFNPVSQATEVIAGTDKIEKSIYMILSTRKGERFFLPEFGSDLHKAVFEPNTLIFADMVALYVEDALSTWEQRIQVLGIDVGIKDERDNIVPVSISYRIKNTNMLGTYIYPFNVRESGELEVYSFT